MGSKKFVAFLLTLLMVIGMCPTSTMADGEGIAFAVSATPTSVVKDGEIVVTYSIAATANGYSGFVIDLQYDTSLFDFVTASNASSGLNVTPNHGDRRYVYNVSGGINSNYAGDLLSVTYKALAGGTGVFSLSATDCTRVGTQGTESITKSVTPSAPVTVNVDATAISLNPTALIFASSTDTKKTLTATLTPNLSNSKVLWSVEPENVVTIATNTDDKHLDVTPCGEEIVYYKATITSVAYKSDDTPACTATCLVTVQAGALDTVFSITPTSAVVGQMLEATFSNLPLPLGSTVKYQWNKEDGGIKTPVGTDSPKFTPDATGDYSATATITDANGNLYSNNPFTDSVSVGKITQLTPTVVVSASTSNSVTLATATNGFGSVEYGYSATTTSNAPDSTGTNAVIADLSENTEYAFFARFTGDETHTASPWGKVLGKTMFENRTVTTATSIASAAITVEATPTSNVHTGDTVTVTTTNASPTNYKFKEWGFEPTLTPTATTTDENSNTVSFKMPADNVTVTAKYLTIESTPAKPEGTATLTNVESSLVPRPAIKYTPVLGLRYTVTNSPTSPDVDNESAWGVAAADATPVIQQVTSYGEDYYIHAYMPASDADHYRSAATSSNAIRSLHYYGWEAAPTSLSFFARKDGGTEPTSQTVTITNNSTTATNNVTITLSGTDKDSFTVTPAAIATIGANGGKASFAIQPKTGLLSTEKTYLATATIAAVGMQSIEIPLTYRVADKIPVHIGGTITASHVYDKTEFTPITGITATYTDVNGEVQNFPLGNLAYTYKIGGTTVTTHTNVADYTLDIAVNEASATDYVIDNGSISFSITQRPLCIEGVTVEEKTYDGNTTATITSASDGYRLVGTPTSATGICDGDVVSPVVPQTGTFDTKDVADNKTVTIDAITLNGVDSANYKLDHQPTLTGKITPKSITIIATASDKVYDGTSKATISLSFEAGALVGEDTVTISTQSDALFETNGGIAGKNVGTNKAVNIGTISITGANAGNYTISQPTAPHATITQLPRPVTIAVVDPQTYNAISDYPTAQYTPVGVDEQKIKVLYKASGTDDSTYTPTTPTNAGTYILSATITDSNYKFTTLTNDTTPTFVINKATPTGTLESNIGVANAQTTPYEYALSTFGLNPSTGSYAIASYTTEKSILTSADGKAPVIENNNVKFTIVNGATTSDADKITIRFTPSDTNYRSVDLKLNVRRTTDSGTARITGYPTAINLGDDIWASSSNARITVDYTSHADVSASLSDCSATWTDYASDATGSDAIGQKTVRATYTDVAGNLWPVSFTFTVNDVVEAITVTSPTNTSYNIGSTAFDFSGGSYSRTWRSELTTSSTDITQAMCSVNGQPLTTNILNKIGTYTVSVTDADSGKSDSFTIKVVAAPQTDITSPTNEPVAVVEVEATFTDSTTGDPVSPSDIGLDITATDSTKDASLTNALQQKLGSGMRDGVSTMHLTLKSSNGPVNMSGKVRVRVPMPNNSQPGDTFVIAVLDPTTGNITTIVPTKSGNELIFDLPANNVDIAISSKPNSGGTGGFHYYITYTYEDWLRDQERMNLMAPSSGLEPDVKQSGYQQYVNDVITAYGNQQDSFWDAVRKALNNSTPGTIIRANAKTFDQMPVDIMKLVSSKGQTLVVSWSWGKDITITPQNALTPEADRVYYPLSFLVTALSAATTTAAASVLLVPQTGDAIEVLSMTPAGCGMLEGAKPAIGNAVAALDIALDDSAAIAEFPYMAVCLTAFAAALLLAGLAVGKRRKKN